MGSRNSVHVAINLDRTVPIFCAGESVSGTVNVNIKEGRIKVDEVFILLKGETGYTTTRTVTDSNGSSRTETDYHTISFLSEKRVFESPRSGEKELIYHTGQYSWRFDIQIPPQVPPSINEPRKYPHVRYFLKFVIDKPWYKANTYETLYITVFPQVNVVNDTQYLSRSMFGNHNRKDVTLKGYVDKLGYVPGEMVTGTLEIENPRKVFLKQIYLTLFQHYKIECNTKKEKIVQTILPTIVNTNAEYMTEKFSLAIPLTYLAPSYEFHGGFHQKANVHISYILEFDVKADGMFTNFEVPIPIILGTELNTKPNQYEQQYANYSLPNSVSYYPEMISTSEKPPPPYDPVS